MLSNENISKLIVLRGLGYSQQEIADKLNVSRKTIENHLRRLRTKCENFGIYNTYMNNINIVNTIEEKLKEQYDVKQKSD